tara:strand:+ start:784 stop:966 length:183 start_codon:yes stop_codon:yes gene_type:complete
VNDYDVWVVHDHFQVYLILDAEDEEQAERFVKPRMSELGMPDWMYDKANEVNLERKGEWL